MLSYLCCRVLSVKFTPTTAERQRSEMSTIPNLRVVDFALARQEFDRSVVVMSKHKAVVPDGVPAEVMKYCPAVKDSLFDIIQKSRNLRLSHPQGFTQTNFTILYNNKGSENDPSKYHCISSLLNHVYKIKDHPDSPDQTVWSLPPRLRLTVRRSV